MSNILASLRHHFQNLTSTPSLDPLVWRRRARFVAYFEVVGSTLLALVTISLLILSSARTHRTVHHPSFLNRTQEDQDFLTRELVGDLVRSTANNGITTFIDVWASITLFKGTKIGSNHKLSSERSRMWRLSNIIMFMFNSIGAAVDFYEYKQYVFLATRVLGRIVCIFVVTKYMIELSRAMQASNPGSSGLTEVTTT